jgi:hypothetical protein
MDGMRKKGGYALAGLGILVFFAGLISCAHANSLGEEGWGYAGSGTAMVVIGIVFLGIGIGLALWGD